MLSGYYQNFNSMLPIFAKYRKTRLIVWIIICVINISFVGLFFYYKESYGVYNLIAIFPILTLWCMLDLIEIKNLIKLDVLLILVFPSTFLTKYFEILLNEILSIKIISLFVCWIYFIIVSDLIYALCIVLIYFIQSIFVVNIYHVSYRFISISQILRYVLIIPFPILYFGQRVLVKEFFPDQFILLKILLFFGLTIVLSYLVLQKTVEIKFSPEFELLKKIKANNFSW